jgi:hypothetical protein
MNLESRAGNGVQRFEDALLSCCRQEGGTASAVEQDLMFNRSRTLESRLLYCKRHGMSAG